MNKAITRVHYDGIFRFGQEECFGQTSVVEYALRVIGDYERCERKRIGALRNPVTRVADVPRKVIMKQMKQTAGKTIFAPTQLHTFLTEDAHCNAGSLDSFFEHPMPTYSSDEACWKHHRPHCWKMALLNAYRILDMMDHGSVPFPYGWEKIRVDRRKKNFGTLLASAAFQMGRYHAMAIGLESVRYAVRGRVMSEGNKGRLSEVSQMVRSACAELVRRHGELPESSLAGRIMGVLEEWEQASTKGARWLIFTSKGKEDIDAKRIGKAVEGFRKALLR